jgi:hypothetical protein
LATPASQDKAFDKMLDLLKGIHHDPAKSDSVL